VFSLIYFLKFPFLASPGRIRYEFNKTKILYKSVKSIFIGFILLVCINLHYFTPEFNAIIIPFILLYFYHCLVSIFLDWGERN